MRRFRWTRDRRIPSPWRCGSRPPSSPPRTCWRSPRWRPASPAPRRAQRHSAPTSSSPTCRTSILKISGSSLPRALALGCLLNGAGGDLLAQRVVVTGRVVHGGPNGRPLARAWVVLHRVTMGGAGGPIDSSRTDGRGDWTQRVDTVAVFGPIPPGDAKQLSYAYVIPGGAARVAVPIDQPTAEVDLLVEDTVATVTAARLDTLGVQEIERRRFARYRARAVPAGAVVTIAFSVAPAFRAESLVPVVVIAVAAVLAAGFVVALRKKTSDV